MMTTSQKIALEPIKEAIKEYENRINKFENLKQLHIDLLTELEKESGFLTPNPFICAAIIAQINKVISLKI